MSDDLSRLSWVFAHGSLMFDHDFEPAASVPGRAWGWERRFGQPSVRNWGTSDAPAPTSSLSRGSHCDGLLLALPAGEGGSVLASLVDREAKEPVTLTVTTEFGEVPAYTWLMSDAWSALSVEDLTRHATTNVRAGGGPRGNAWNYASGVSGALGAHRLADDLVTRYVDRLAPAVDRLHPQPPPTIGAPPGRA